MGRVLKYLFYLVVLAGLAVVGFAIFSELPAPSSETVIDVTPAATQ